MKNFLTLAVFIIALQPCFAQYQGKVFVDANANGLADVHEKGVVGVLVSNGETVVKTDENGNFNLPTSDRDKFIFITKPSGYRAESFFLRNNGQDETYLFPLQEEKDPDDFTFIQISDTETSDSTGWVKMLRDYSSLQKPSFIMHTGDICYEAGMRFHAEHVNTGKMGLPVYYTVGNHDLVAGEYGEKLFEDLFGPVYYSFDYGNVHFIVTPMPSGDFKPGYTLDDVYTWLKNDLANVPKDKPKVIFNHDLLFANEGFNFTSKGETLDLEANGLKAWVYGHWHNNFFQTHKNTDVVSICTNPPNMGGIDQTIASFRVFDMKQDGAFTTEIVHSYLDHQLSIASPAPRTRLSKENEFSVLVNAYNSVAPVKDIKFNVNGGAEKQLKQSSNWAWTETVKVDRGMKRDSVNISVIGTFADGRMIEKNRSVRLLEYDRPDSKNALLTKAEPAENRFTLNWVSNLGSNVYQSSPLVADGKVFLASFDDADLRNSFVFAYETASGKLLWKSKTRNSVKQTVAYAEGKVLAIDQVGFLYAFDAENGDLVWEADLGTGSQPGYVGGLVVNDSIVYTGDGLGFSALSIDNGQRIWKNNKWGVRMGGPSKPAVGGGVVVGSSNWNHLFAFDQQTGAPLWSNAEGGLRFRNSAPVFHEGYFYVTSVKSIFKLDTATGKIIATKETDFDLSSSSVPLISGNKLIVGSGDSGLLAFDLDSFDLIWKFEVGPSLTASIAYRRANNNTVAGSPLLDQGMLYFGGLDGVFYGINAMDGKLVKSIDLGSPIYSSAWVSNSEVYISDLAGNLYSFQK